MDLRVLQAQQWVNATYKTVSGYVACSEDGITGWLTMYSLTRGLQHELGITALSDNFGDTTLSKLTAYGPISVTTANVNLRTIVECGLYCKGYSGGFEDGLFGTDTQTGLYNWKTDMGFSAPQVGNSVSAKEMKALLTMDAYVLLVSGNSQVRSVQRWMNATYISRKDYQIVPCDGYFSRNVQRGLMLGIQYSEGMADGVADGIWGANTAAGLKATAATLTTGSADSGSTKFVQLFKAALIFNSQPGVDWGTATFTTITSAVAGKFQTFCGLTVTGKGDYQTWCSLLVSTGDPTRKGKAADCATPLNDARAKAIKAAGYETVGRYIGGGASKQLTSTEIQTILANTLTFFPIYQESNNALGLFTPASGTSQGTTAHANALALGLPPGSIIYFAVDVDVTGDEIRSNVLPFFANVNAAFHGLGDRYSVGVYGTRNTCSMVCDGGYAISSFVGGLSVGWSGNLGFPLPSNWAFDQIATPTLASGTAGQIQVDNDMKSGRDKGISSLSVSSNQNDAFFTWVVWIEARAVEWRAQGHTDNTTQQLTAMYLRTYIDSRYDSGMDLNIVFGGIDHDFINYCHTLASRPNPSTLRDPKTGMLCDIQHFGAALCSVLGKNLNSDKTVVTLVDAGGWAGDLLTMDITAWNQGIADANTYTWGYGLIGNTANQGEFGASDLVADVDAMVVGLAIRKSSSTSISAALTGRYASVAAARSKYQEFVTARFGNTTAMQTAAYGVGRPALDDGWVSARAALWQTKTGPVGQPIGLAYSNHPALFDGVAKAFVDVFAAKFTS